MTGSSGSDPGAQRSDVRPRRANRSGEESVVRSRQPKGLALGATAIARSGLSQANADATVASAWAAGIRYFDTAPMYGGGRSELMLGRALAAYPRDSFTLSSKVGRLVRRDEPKMPGEDELWRYDFSKDGVIRSLEESLARLGQDYLDIVYIHDPDAFVAEASSTAYQALISLREDGRLGAIGVGMTQVPALQALVQRIDLDVILVAGRFSLIDNEAKEELLPLCQRQEVDVVLAQTLHGGLIDGRQPTTFHYRPTPPDVRAGVRRIANVCGRYEVPLPAVAFNYVLADPAVAVVLTGPENPQQLDDNLFWSRLEVPAPLWQELAERSLIPETAAVLTL